MLIFSKNIMCGDPHNFNGVKIYNLSSCLEGYERLDHLTPPRVVNGFFMDINDPDKFYALYIQYLGQSTDAFMELMDIVAFLYEGFDIIVLVGSDPYRDTLTECLSKFIQQRYGYISNIVTCLEDTECLVNGSFTIPGLAALDLDKEAYWRNVAASSNVYVGKGLDDYD